MEGFNSLIENASTKDLWLMHGAIIEKLKNIDLDTPSASSVCDTESTSSNRNKSRKLSDFIPYFASGILTSPEPCYIKILDNLVKADLVLEDGKCFFKSDNLIFKSPSAFAQHHSNQITPLHPKATKPGSGWSHIMLEKNDKRLSHILSVKAVKKTKGMTAEQKTLSSERSKKWAAEAHEILAVMRATNPDATYNDAQKELKKRKTVQSDSEEEKPEKKEETKFIDSIIYKYISRLSESELKNAPFLLTMKFGMTIEEAEKYLS